ncbi:MAG: hypothetical protein WDO24_04790 [Pseudomonadota bacterium]
MIGTGRPAAAPVGPPDSESRGAVALLDQALWRDLAGSEDERCFGEAWLALACRMIPAPLPASCCSSKAACSSRSPVCLPATRPIRRCWRLRGLPRPNGAACCRHHRPLRSSRRAWPIRCCSTIDRSARWRSTSLQAPYTTRARRCANSNGRSLGCATS